MTTTRAPDKRRRAYAPLQRLAQAAAQKDDPANLSPTEEALLLQDAETSAKMYMASLSDWYTGLIEHLMNRKQLPSFYFLDAAQAAGIPKDTYKNWKIREWPNTTPRNPQRICDIVQTLLLVMVRLNAYPYDETYFQALDRLQQRIIELKNKYSQNALTELMNLPHNTIDNILTSTTRQHAKFVHCPWRLLDKLADAEERIEAATKLEMPEYGYLSNSRADRVSEEEIITATRTIEARTIEIGGQCHKCRAPWPSLRYDSPVQEYPGLNEFYCLNCAADNYVRTDPIERHSRCPICQWPWWWMHRKKGADDDRLVMICNKCGMENRVVSKGVPPEGFERLHRIRAAVDYDDETRHDD